MGEKLGIESKEENYKLRVSGKDETLMKSNGKLFKMNSKDKCSGDSGGWWFACGRMSYYVSQLNAFAPSSKANVAFDSNFWLTWNTEKYEPFTKTQMLLEN